MRARVGKLLWGPRPSALLWFTVPAGVSLAIDLALRPRALAGYALQGQAIYGSSLLVSTGFWMLPLWGAGRLLVVQGAARARAHVTLAALVAAILLPLVTFAFAGQVLYFRVFHSYMGRDTLRLGIALRGTVGDWFGSWGGPGLMAGMLLAGRP